MKYGFKFAIFLIPKFCVARLILGKGKGTLDEILTLLDGCDLLIGH